MRLDNFLNALYWNSNTLGQKPFDGILTTDVSCPIDLPLTCRNATEVTDSCCFEFPGGIFLQTQFWNYRPSRVGMNATEIENELGPLDAFTIHGLWPDNCDGGFEQFCDKSLFIDDVYHLLKSDEFNGENSQDLEISGENLLNNLTSLWKSNNGNHESLWIHEFNKHGSCINTLKPKCYKNWNNISNSKSIVSKEENDYYKKRAVYDYFRITYNLYNENNSFEKLAKFGIVPSNSTTYTKEQIENALGSTEGTDEVTAKIFINCDSNNVLNEVWYFYLLKGSLLQEEFVPIDSFDNKRSRCKATGIKFYQKGYIPNNGGRQPPSNSKRGIVRISGYNGNLIKNGRWMTKGTPANFEMIKSPFGSYYLKSRTGYCTVSVSKGLICNANINNAAQFDYDDKNGYIGYSNNFMWSAETYPRGNTQSVVYFNNKDNKYQFKLKFV
ncbi:hypothetical protein TPHA_0F03140 [Tetrapisispora phaffii CBS 4417]|uniref:Ribonuclease T2-like n=1 Tax=Tetrapisispora phaffii (strain ATCC 24235 / CBS 4417 / NBRC 1672 / NRRL Y-8282 / UCD 70-5) TaxID=1071381 RepID=G8BUK9_TETPH|nr:hypothetical protein TPHA_0F03140 [Tetrapisispora phaffii CBS 4417]CCE63795.1 hypothetical protein TPHA_0F03140 [Tetrapisispora phaffii CBS 4417]